MLAFFTLIKYGTIACMVASDQVSLPNALFASITGLCYSAIASACLYCLAIGTFLSSSAMAACTYCLAMAVHLYCSSFKAASDLYFSAFKAAACFYCSSFKAAACFYCSAFIIACLSSSAISTFFSFLLGSNTF
jgi:hypothetical protein